MTLPFTPNSAPVSPMNTLPSYAIGAPPIDVPLLESATSTFQIVLPVAASSAIRCASEVPR